ncbi:unnamed protein product [Cylicocyclus nassatus]|uniref:Knottin scorpion toxin-like domain-containing protein n=1 Tax=Cylicocyclus nassatus TaxID=53992 RepID=A0AA36MFM4_CYLNA|nr:unnamed protein product [Cylicocyclus nassatus]
MKRCQTKQKMMRHFIAFSLLLFVLEISVEATLLVPNRDFSVFISDSACRARCLKELNCQKGHCKKAANDKIFFARCVCEDCLGRQKTKEVPVPMPVLHLPF